MAEIKVEKKNKAPIWPWIIGILILLGLIWLLINAFGDDADQFDPEEIDPQEVEGSVGENNRPSSESFLLTESDFTRA